MGSSSFAVRTSKRIFAWTKPCILSTCVQPCSLSRDCPSPRTWTAGFVSRRSRNHISWLIRSKPSQVCYWHGKQAEEVERMDYLEFIARVTSHIPDKGQVTVRYYGLHANAQRGKVKKASPEVFPLPLPDFLLNLTSDDTAIYHPQRWGKARLAYGTLTRPAQQKTNFLSEGLDYKKHLLGYVPFSSEEWAGLRRNRA